MFGKVQEVPQTEKHHFIQEVLMVLPNYMHTGLQLIIERFIKFLLVMEFCLTMKALLEEKRL